MVSGFCIIVGFAPKYSQETFEPTNAHQSRRCSEWPIIAITAAIRRSPVAVVYL